MRNVNCKSPNIYARVFMNWTLPVRYLSCLLNFILIVWVNRLTIPNEIKGISQHTKLMSEPTNQTISGRIIWLPHKRVRLFSSLWWCFISRLLTQKVVRFSCGIIIITYLTTTNKLHFILGASKPTFYHIHCCVQCTGTRSYQSYQIIEITDNHILCRLQLHATS